MLVAVMLVIGRPPTFTHAAVTDRCSSCGAYSVNYIVVAGGHQAQCSNCNYRSNTLNHSYYWKYDSNTHWMECRDCGYSINSGYHRDPSNTGYCQDCGAKFSSHVHTIVTKYDSNYHWEGCTTCNYATNKTAHTLDNMSTNNGHYLQCRYCKYSSSIEAHNYVWKYNSSNHWKECSTCLHSINSGPHEYDTARPGYCRICGAPITHQHTMVSEYDYQYHWKRCSLCGLIQNKEAHTLKYNVYDNGHEGVCKYCNYYSGVVPHDAQWYIHTDYHYKMCSKCQTMIVPVGSHVEDPANKGYCKDCGAKFSSHVHDFVREWDRQNHWDRCQSCGLISNKIPHDLHYNTVDSGHQASCSGCQYKTNVTAHLYDWYYDGTCHWKICPVCGDKTEKESHVEDPVNTGYCKLCGAKITHVHDFVKEWDRQNHWDRCQSCNLISNKIPHDLYYNIVDSGHQASCSGCQYKTNVMEHLYDWYYDGTYHWKVCPTCGDRTVKESHIDNPNHRGYCKICGAKISHTHTNVKEWDTESHWDTCTICGYKSPKVAHTIKYTTVVNGHEGRCTECSYVIAAVPHNYVIKFNELHHWNECKDCGHMEDKAPHIEDPNKPGYCQVCGIQVTHQHKLVKEYNETEHWERCTECDYVVNKELHTLSCKPVEGGHKTSCSECSYTSSVMLHTYIIMSDDSYHWKQCQECSHIIEHAHHVPDPDKPGYCKVCGKFFQIQFDFDATGGIGGSGTLFGSIDDVLVPKDPSRRGYIFTHWNALKNGTGNHWPSDNIIHKEMIIGNPITYYAQWLPLQFTVVLDANGGDISALSEKSKAILQNGQTLNQTFETLAGSLNNIKQIISVGTKPTEAGTVEIQDPSSPNKIYAAFVKDAIVIYSPATEIYINENSAGMLDRMPNLVNKSGMKWWIEPGTQNKFHDSLVAKAVFGIDNGATLPKNVFTKTGYTFAGWTNEVSKDTTNVLFSDGDVVPYPNTFSEREDSMNLYAVWNPNHYTVVFEPNGAAGVMQPLEMVYNQSSQLTSNAFQKVGYTFAGWNTRSDGKGQAYADQESVKNLHVQDNGTVTLYAQWRPNTYILRFEGNGHTSGEMPDQVVTYNVSDKIHKNAFKRDGYIFMNWKTTIDGTVRTFEDEDAVINLSADDGTVFVLQAQWQKNAYTILYDKNNDAATGTMENQEVPCNTAVNLSINKFTYYGYKFDSWNTKPDGSGIRYLNAQEVTELSTVPGSTVTLYAQWKPVTYTIVFNPNGGTGEMAPITVTYGVEATLPTLGFSRTGYPFTGWNTRADGKGTSFADKATVLNLGGLQDQTVILYAQWNAAVYYLNFHKNANDATGTMSKQPLTYDVPQQLAKNLFERPGYTFIKWAESPDGSGKTYLDQATVKNLTTENKKELNLYAQWAANVYYVDFDKNDPAASGTMERQMYIYDTVNTLPENKFTKTGYHFTGWNTRADGTGTPYSNMQEIQNLSNQKNGVVTLYAQWAANTYSVVFHKNGNDVIGIMETQSFVYDIAQELTQNTYNRNGYTFAGWNTRPTGTGTPYQDGATVKNLTYQNNGVVTLYAQWIPNEYILRFDGNGHTSGTMADQIVKYGSTVTINANTYQRRGYSFTGWKTTIDGQERIFKDKESIKNLTSVDQTVFVLTAQWGPIEYTINYDKNEPLATGTMASQKTYYDTVIKLNPNGFAYHGYNFDSWNTKPNGTGIKFINEEEVKNIYSDDGGTITLYAQWTPITYTISFDPNGGTGKMESITLTYDQPATLPQLGFTKTGYPFGMWNTRQDGRGTSFDDQATVLNLTGEHGKVITLYAQWNAAIYYLNFNKNAENAIGTMNRQPMTYDVSQQISKNVFERIGYAFAKWAENPNGSGRTFLDQETVKNLTSVNKQTIELYAQWEPHVYFVEFDANTANAEGVMEHQRFVYDTEQPLTQNVFTKPGYNFIGWSLNPNGSGTKYTDKQAVKNLTADNNGVVRLYAQWERNSYTVVYDKNNVDAVGSMPQQPFTYDSPQSLLKNSFSRVGYTFDSWNTQPDGSGKRYVNEARVNNLTDEKDGVVTLYAQWKVNTYVLQFAGNHNTSGVMNNQTIEYGKKTNIAKNAFVRRGYTFTHWNGIINGVSRDFLDEEAVYNLSSVNGTIFTLRAQWSANGYLISFNKNNRLASGFMDDQVMVYDVADNLAKNQFAYHGYTFDSWNTAPDGSGTSYKDGESVQNLCAENGLSITLYAQWKPNTYTVAFDSNGGTGTMESFTLKYDEKATLPKMNFEKMGYPFTSWNTKRDGTGTSFTDQAEICNLTGEPGKVITLYAQWSAAVYYLNFHKNATDAEGTMQQQTLTYDIAQPISKNLFTRTGYTFAKWAENPNGSGKSYLDQAIVKNLTTEDKKEIDLYAQWKVNSYYIEFNKNDAKATGTMPRQKFQFNVSQALNQNAYTKEGYTFVGWNTNSDGTGTEYKNKQELLNLTTENNKVITLYAQWTANHYTVAFNKNAADATGDMLAQPFDYDVAQKLRKNEFNRVGYDFKGWTLTEDGSGTLYGDEEVVKNLTPEPYGIATLYAQWTPHEYYIKFNPNISNYTGTMSKQKVVYDKPQTLTMNTYESVGHVFNGWNTMPNGTGDFYYDQQEVKNLATKNNEVVNLYAQWLTGACYIIFNGNGADHGMMPKQGAVYGEETSLFKNAFTRTGHHFTKWSTSSDGTGASYLDQEVIIYAAGQPDLILYAQWEPNKYYITYNKNAATATGTMERDVVNYGETKTLKANAYVRPGHTFIGWNTAPDGSGTAYDANAQIQNLAEENNGVMTLYAQWRTNKYQIVYDKNHPDAEGSTPPTDVIYGDKIIIPNCEFTRAGYTCEEWNTKPDGTGTVYKAGMEASDLVSEDNGKLTLYAQWDPIPYTIIFQKNFDQATGGMENQTINYDVEEALLQNQFHAVGYAFKEWNTSADGSGTSYQDQAIVKNLSVDGSEITLYAQWKPSNYIMRFHKNDAVATGTMSDQTIAYGAETALTKNQFTKPGYTFINWSVTPDGSGTVYADGASVKDLTNINGEVIDLYAQWSTIRYYVAFDPNTTDVSGTMKTVTYGYDQEQRLPANTFVKPGYKFIEWNTEANGTGTKYADQSPVLNLANVEGSTVTLYAQWKTVNYTVIFDKNSDQALGTMGTQNMAFDSPTKLLKNNYTRPGYQFDSWNTKADGTGKKYLDEQEVKNLSIKENTDVRLYAQWKPITYIVSFKPGVSGVIGTMNNQEIPYNTETELIQNRFVRPGYTFIGWTLEQDENGTMYKDQEKVLNLGTQQGQIVTLYANWDRVKYYFDFDGNGATSGTMTRQGIVYGERDTLTRNTFIRNGYTFAGWNTEKDGSGKAYHDGQSVYNETDVGEEVIILYAQWDAITCTITYELNGGNWKSGYQPPTSKKYDESVHLPGASNVTRDGFMFMGWYTKENCSGMAVTDLKSEVGDTTLYARWYDMSRNNGVSNPIIHDFSTK